MEYQLLVFDQDIYMINICRPTLPSQSGSKQAFPRLQEWAFDRAPDDQACPLQSPGSGVLVKDVRVTLGHRPAMPFGGASVVGEGKCDRWNINSWSLTKIYI